MDPLQIKSIFLYNFGQLQGSSFNLCRAVVKTFFDYCIENKTYLDSNPLETVKRKKKGKKLPNPFKDEQLEEILDKCPKEHRFMHEVFLNSGVRLSELLNLQFQDFDSENHVLHVKGVSGGGGAKGDKSRDINITPLLLKKYESYLADYRLKNFTGSDYVFVNQDGNKLASVTIQQRMRRLSKKLKFRIHAHRFRCTYATNLHKSGVSVVIISLLMGHESIETTMTYISVSEWEKREAVQKGTYLGKLSEEAKRIEKGNREKAGLIAQIKDSIEINEALLKRVKRLNV